MQTTTRATPKSKAVDEEFLQQLYRGGELLAQGKVIEAKDFLERAYQLQPRNEKGQNLLGLTYFKLGLFDRAAEIYEALVRDNPVDPTLRVNLGLVYLKTNALQRAIREFETAVDLAPDHQKAQNYLGLALAQAGEYGRAREHFVLAGSDAMAEKMSRAIAGEVFEKPAPKPLAKQKGFSEIEGSEVVAEQGGQPVGAAQAAAAVQEPPAEEEDVQIVVDEDPPPEAAAQAPVSSAAPVQAAAPAQAAAPEEVAHDDWGAGFEGTAAEHAPAVDAQTGDAQGVADLPVLEDVPLDAAALTVAEHPAQESAPAATPPAQEPLPTEEGNGATGPQVAQAHSAAAPPAATRGGLARAEALAPMLPLAAPGIPAPAVGPGASAPTVAQASPSAALGPAPLLTELVPSVQLLRFPVQGPFQLQADTVSVVVKDEVLTRISGLIAICGTLELTPEMKRSRGRATDRSFGEGDRQVYRARGNGLLTVNARGHSFVAVDLADESGYFREEVVFAFEEPVMFENGRVPSHVPPDLDLVHLRGKGQVLLQPGGPLRSLEVRMDRPITIPLAYLVGWHGNLTPRVMPLGVDQKGKPARSGVELSGEGFALFSVPV